MARLFSDDENAIIVKDDGTPVLIVGEDEEFSALGSTEEKMEYIDEYYSDQTDYIGYPVEADFVIEVLEKCKALGIDFKWKCAMCSAVIDSDTVCKGYNPTPPMSSIPDYVAVCPSCLKEICFKGEDGFFNEEFNKIALAYVARVGSEDGVGHFRIMNEGDQCSGDIIWKGRVYDLVWGDDSFTVGYRKSKGINDEAMARDNEIAYGLIMMVGEEIEE